jgi:glycerol-3-phosphate dehydrogenase subunit B
MTLSSSNRFELTVIGTGIAGLAAALFAAQKGVKTAIVGRSAEILFASGFLDVLGVHPIETRQVWDDPWEGIAALAGSHPNHPYARMPASDIRESIQNFIEFLSRSGLPYRNRPDRNVLAISPMGTAKPTYGLPASMWNVVATRENATPCLIVGLDGLKGFSARLIAETHKPVWPKLRPVQIAYPVKRFKGELYAERIAHDLELTEHRAALARLVRSHIRSEQAVGMPAIFGLYRSQETYEDLEQRMGVPLFEIPTMPPSICGMRIKAVFEKMLPELGVQAFFQEMVLSASYRSKQGFLLEIGGAAFEQTVRSDGVILASGRFLGRGLHAERKRIRETIFDLPVFQPGNRADWHGFEFFDPKGHPINRCGLETDDRFRPLDRSSRPAHPNLFAAGSILAHQDWMREKCGSGLAIASAHAAVSAYLELRR